MGSRSFISALALILAAGNCYAADIFVSAGAAEGGEGTAEAPYATFAQAVAAATPGDQILLASGDYKFSAPKKFFEGKLVTVRPAKDAAGKVKLTGLSTTFSFMRFVDLQIPEIVRIRDGKWIQFVRCNFGPTTTQSHWGMSFMNSDHCGLYGCRIETLSTSQMNMMNVTNTDYRFNEVTNGASDAFQGGGENILIEGNWIHDFSPAKGAHPDGIQLSNTKKLTVRGNVFECGNMQTFFLYWTTKETTYEDFVIENNVCTTASVHGLSTSPSTDMLVRNNLFIPDKKHASGIASIELKNMRGTLTVQNNIFWQLSIAPRGKDVISHNVYMQKHWKSGTPGDSAILTTPDACFVDRGAYDYRLKEGSPAIGAAKPGTVPETDILGRRRSKDKPSIGPSEPQKDDKPFMEMWKAHFRKMQAEVQPPDPSAGA